MLTKEVSYLLMRLSVVRPIETRKFIAVSRQYLKTEVRGPFVVTDFYCMWLLFLYFCLVLPPRGTCTRKHIHTQHT